MMDPRPRAMVFERLRARLDDARRRPAGAVSPTERDALKQEIIALFREAHVALAEAQLFKESVRGLVDAWKQLDRSDATATPPSSSAVPSDAGSKTGGPRRDHLGAATFIEKGWTRLSLEDFVGAEVALRRALELVPEQNEAESLLAWALMQQERHAEAALVAQAVLARDPRCAVAHVALGYVAMQQAREAEAVERLSHAIAIDGDHKATLYAHLYLGMVYRQQGMPEAAEDCYRRTLELGPNCLQAWYERGRNHWAEGRVDEAVRAWRAGGEANKFSPWGKRCTEVVRHVEQGRDPFGR